MVQVMVILNKWDITAQTRIPCAGSALKNGMLWRVPECSPRSVSNSTPKTSLRVTGSRPANFNLPRPRLYNGVRGCVCVRVNSLSYRSDNERISLDNMIAMVSNTSQRHNCFMDAISYTCMDTPPPMRTPSRGRHIQVRADNCSLEAWAPRQGPSYRGQTAACPHARGCCVSGMRE